MGENVEWVFGFIKWFIILFLLIILGIPILFFLCSLSIGIISGTINVLPEGVIWIILIIVLVIILLLNKKKIKKFLNKKK